jgi:hypothetical protein
MSQSLPDVHFGEATEEVTNWRDKSDEDDADDDEVLEKTPQYVIDMLGFDPLDVFEDE